jgi:hypothetical protein
MSILRTNSVQSPNLNTVLSTSGSIIQTVFVRTDERLSYSAITTGDGNTMLPLGLTITPRSIGSRLICQWMINGEVHQDVVILMHRNNSLITTAGEQGYNQLTGNIRWSGLASGFYDRNEDSTPSNFKITYSQISDSLEPRTYCPAVRSSSTGVYTFHLNRTISVGDLGQDAYERMVSMGVIYEVAV